MKFEVQLEAESTSECRALVPLTVTAEDKARGYSLANAAFLTQLAANKKGFSQYRAKRRAKPEAGANSYRTTIADALAYQSKGTKLNFVA